MSRVELALRHIVDELARGPHPFALVGGFAVSARTEPRFTRAIDLVALNAERGFSRGRDLEAALDDLLAGS